MLAVVARSQAERVAEKNYPVERSIGYREVLSRFPRRVCAGRSDPRGDNRRVIFHHIDTLHSNRGAMFCIGVFACLVGQDLHTIHSWHNLQLEKVGLVWVGIRRSSLHFARDLQSTQRRTEPANNPNSSTNKYIPIPTILPSKHCSRKSICTMKLVRSGFCFTIEGVIEEECQFPCLKASIWAILL